MIVTEAQITKAMIHWENAHKQAGGKLDGISIPKECSKLADLLGVMWFHGEQEAEIPDGSPLAQLILAPAQG